MKSKVQGTQDCSGRFLPVLIIPGFMSSGLEVKSSAISKGWVGKRVWINLSALGFESLYWGGPLHLNESKRKQGGTAASGYSEKLHEDYSRQLECKNNWLQHMSLSDDMVTERPGMEVRPIPGLAGVDYLTPGALTSHVSYVFGPVIQALRKAGYTDDNLDAAPYDWRLPPSALENRDGYFTSTMRKVEELSRKSGGAPVVLLCHSMGCKTGHYFLNFVQDHPDGGPLWLDRHIHTYMPVGAPHLGAPKSLRATVDGDKMGLDAFLTDEEGLLLGRSLGSGPWLMPRELSVSANAPPNVFLRREGALEVTVLPIDCASLIRRRKGRKPKLRLSVALGKEVLATDFRELSGANGNSLILPESFVFSTPADPAAFKGKDDFQIFLEEPGIGPAKKDRRSDLREAIGCIMSIACCPIKYVLCLPCTLAKCIVWNTLCTAKEVTLKGADAAASAVGSATPLACSQKAYLQTRLTGYGETKIMANLIHVRDRSLTFTFFRKQRSTVATLRLKWIPPTEGRGHQSECQIATPGDSACSNVMHIKHHSKDIAYDASDGRELFETEGLQNALSLIRERYNADSLGPRTLSAEGPPPVRRVKAIFGINLPTEVGAVYRRRRSVLRVRGKIQKLRELDKASRATKPEDASSRKYKIEDGIIFETKKTAQTVDGEVVHRSGDGTVPYWSLSHCRQWKDNCSISVEEIEAAEHREILADSRFHKILVDYVTGAALDAKDVTIY